MSLNAGPSETHLLSKDEPYLDISAIAIGRNEGPRLEACLSSLAGRVRRVVYVDSGSTDDSLEIARKSGAEVVELDTGRPFTAARARNGGLARLPLGDTGYVQFLDGDCILQPGWLAAARSFLEDNPDCAVVCGRRRERQPESSIYNQLCDLEWDTPIGETKACGGDALMRLSAVRAIGGFREDLIAGEEPELCVRLRKAGQTIWRLDHEMTLHDAAMTRFLQWWRRSMRGGHAFAEGAFLHGAPPERHWKTETRRAISWGGVLPLAAVSGAVLIHPALLTLLLAYPAQILRLTYRSGGGRTAFVAACFTMLVKLPELLGVLQFHLRRVRGQKSTLIEYKKL